MGGFSPFRCGLRRHPRRGRFFHHLVGGPLERSGRTIWWEGRFRFGGRPAPPPQHNIILYYNKEIFSRYLMSVVVSQHLKTSILLGVFGDFWPCFALFHRFSTNLSVFFAVHLAFRSNYVINSFDKMVCFEEM